MASGRDAKGGRPRILVVDDDEEVLASMRQLIEMGVPGCEVVAARDGAEAWGHLRGNGFRAVVTDYRMPNMDGLQLAARARERTPGLPIILLTAFHDPDLAAQAQRAGVSRLMRKPFAVGEFLAALHDGIAT